MLDKLLILISINNMKITHKMYKIILKVTANIYLFLFKHKILCFFHSYKIYRPIIMEKELINTDT